MKKMKIISLLGCMGKSFCADTISKEGYEVKKYCAVFWDGDETHEPILANHDSMEKFVVVMNQKRTRAFVGNRTTAVATNEADVPDKLVLANGGVFMAIWLDETTLSANFIQIKNKPKGYSHIILSICAEGEYDTENLEILENMFKGCVEAIPTWKFVKDSDKQRIARLVNTEEAGGEFGNEEKNFL